MPIAQYIDHTLLSPVAREEEVRRVCREAVEFGFRAVCVSGCRLELARAHLQGSGVLLAAVVGFPHGNAATEVKCREAETYAGSGADELDMVLNVGWIKDGETRKVAGELKRIRETVRGTTLKLILETCYLEDGEKRLACELAREAGWDFVKTSTGFGPGGATLADVALMKETLGSALQIKASGGIRDYPTAMEYLKAGATRIGTSSGPAIVLGEKHTAI